MTTLIEVRDLRVTYGTEVALDDVALTVEAGEIVAVVGANGTGKTTLLRALASLLPAASTLGEVCGHALGSIGARAAASLAGDEPVFFTDASLIEQLTYLAALGDQAGDRAADHVAMIIELLDLDERVDAIPTTFSRGWRQRASLACAMARGAPVLLIDEPFVGLDVAGRAQFVAAVDWYRSGGNAVVLATHDLDDLTSLSPRTVPLGDS